MKKKMALPEVFHQAHWEGTITLNPEVFQIDEVIFGLDGQEYARVSWHGGNLLISGNLTSDDMMYLVERFRNKA